MIDFIKSIEKMIKYFLSRKVETATIGVIESYDPETRKATVTPLINNGEMEYQPIVDVPVCQTVTKKARVTIPIEKGDTVLLVTVKRNIGTWLYKGGKSTPETSDEFDLNNVVAIPFVYPFVFNEAAGEQNNNTLQVIFKSMALTMTDNDTILIKNGSCEMKMTSTQFSVNGENLTVDL